MRIAVDIDNTLTSNIWLPDWRIVSPNEYMEYYRTAPARKEVINKVNEWYDSGHIIFIYTSRDIYFREVTEKWLNAKGVKYHDIIYGKLFFDLLLDDKAENEIRRLEDRLK